MCVCASVHVCVHVISVVTVSIFCNSQRLAHGHNFFSFSYAPMSRFHQTERGNCSAACKDFF